MKLSTCIQGGWERQYNHLALLETEANKEINGVRRKGYLWSGRIWCIGTPSCLIEGI